MGILDRLFGGSRARETRPAERGVEVVPLADRTPLRSFTTELVGVDDVNHDGGSRQAAIRHCTVGEEAVLLQESRPRRQPAAIGVWSTVTGEQLGYLALDVVGYVMMHARRHDFRSVIEELPEQEDGVVGVTLRMEVFEKQR